MAVLRLGRFRAGPAGTGEMLTSHATLGAAVEDAFPGSPACSWQRPATGEGPVWRWDSLAGVQPAVPARPASRRPGPHFRPPKASQPGTRTSSMRDRTRPVHGKDMADPYGGRHACRRAWPAPPPGHGIVLVLAARRGSEQA
jgi:hypothetical protein